MTETLKNSISALLTEYYDKMNEERSLSENELDITINVIKQIPFVKNLIEENNRLKFQNKTLQRENEKYSNLETENINLEINECVSEPDEEHEELNDELSVGGENQDDNDLLIN